MQGNNQYRSRIDPIFSHGITEHVKCAKKEKKKEKT